MPPLPLNLTPELIKCCPCHETCCTPSHKVLRRPRTKVPATQSCTRAHQILPLPRNLHALSHSVARATHKMGPRSARRATPSPFSPCRASVHPCSPSAAPATKSGRQVAKRCAAPAKQKEARAARAAFGVVSDCD